MKNEDIIWLNEVLKCDSSTCEKKLEVVDFYPKKISLKNKMKKLLIKWLCKPCKEQSECLESLDRVYIGSHPIIGDSLFYLTSDEFGNQSYTSLPSGRYKLNGKVLVIENELVKSYE